MQTKKKKTRKALEVFFEKNVIISFFQSTFLCSGVMEDIPVLQEQWERDWREPGDALRALQTRARGRLAPGGAARVSMLDAGVLNEQVETLLVERLRSALVPNVVSPAAAAEHAPELTLAVRALLWAATVGRRGTTYGDDLQNIAAPRLAQSRATRALHFALSVVLPWVWARFTRAIAQRGWWQPPIQHHQDKDDDDKQEQEKEQKHEERKQWWHFKIWQAVRVTEKAYAVAVLANMAVFLCRGDYPTLASRVLRAGVPRVRNSAMRRTVLHGAMQRQLLWEGATEAALLVLPLALSPPVRRAAAVALRRARTLLLPRTARQDAQHVAPGGCALCGTTPARTAYVCPRTSSSSSSGECKDCFCYLCAFRALADEPRGFECPQCHARVTSVVRAGADDSSPSPIEQAVESE